VIFYLAVNKAVLYMPMQKKKSCTFPQNQILALLSLSQRHGAFSVVYGLDGV
jgi:hypothetical protein